MENCADRAMRSGEREVGSGSPIRSFICVSIPSQVRHSVADVQQELRAVCRDVKWVRPESMHITLKFLGDVEQDRIQALKLSLERAVSSSSPFLMSLDGLGRFPKSGRARVIWAGIRQGAVILKTLAQSVDEACVSLGFEREKRPFSPHLTLGRVRRGALIDAERCLQNNDFTSGSFEVREMQLMKSDLLPSGARYTVIHSIKFKG